MKCKANIESTNFHAMCSRKVIVDGYCWQHHPNNVAARAKKRAELEIVERRLFWLHAYGPQFHDVLQQIADGAPNPVELAKRMLREFKEE